ncbi:MAG: GIY-YIG nuclease family protein [Candidatus Pacebacteria bacterium]|nr:GIY-YIG nuclease family protein [Candidatus Paceibacterota bacterium]
MKAQVWYVYILKCADSTLYTGITTDLIRRLEEHNQTRVGAKYTKIRRPVRLVYQEIYKNRSESSKREAEIKKLSRSEKQRLFL